MNVKEILKNKKEIIDPILRECAKVPDERIYEMVLHPINAGGKRLRPAMTLLACEAVGADQMTALPAAASIELLHTFTLVHDDIMDNDDERRGLPTVHTLWGNDLGILVGDALYVVAYKAMLGLKDRDVSEERIIMALSEFIEANEEVNIGQIMDMMFEEEEEVDMDSYIKMISKKTGKLIEASVTVGAIVGGAETEVVEALRVFGSNCGLAFQIKDDVLDLKADRKKFGKPVGSDIKSGKKTLMIIHARLNASPSQWDEISKILGDDTASDETVMQAIQLLEEIGSISYAEDMAKNLVEDGKKALDILPESEAKTGMIAIADYFIERQT